MFELEEGEEGAREKRTRAGVADVEALCVDVCGNKIELGSKN